MRSIFLTLALMNLAMAQQPARDYPENHRPPLFFREEWKMVPADVEHPIDQQAVQSAGLVLKLYGDGKGGVKPDHGIWVVKHEQPLDEPVHTWTGLCQSSCAFALQDKDNFVDLSGLAKMRWQYKVLGFHLLRPIVKLADGTWLIADHTSGSQTDWHDDEVTFSDLRWLKLNIAKVLEAPGGKWVEHPDLTKVDEIGFTDLMAGGGHGLSGFSDVGRIEVFGKPVKR